MTPDNGSNILDVSEMQKFSANFVKERDWEKFQTPKNLAIGISIEASELVEIFQWLTDEESVSLVTKEDKMQMIKDEIGDIFNYIIRLSDVLGINLGESFYQKMEKTKAKYPVEKVKGRKEKYSEYPLN